MPLDKVDRAVLKWELLVLLANKVAFVIFTWSQHW
jgi:hypothetical protein